MILTGARIFSKLDLKWGYHQIELDEQSRQYTTFATHTGLYRYKHLMFGVSAAPEIYQHVIQQALQGCPGVKNISDDLIVFGKNQQEHDTNLNGVLSRLQDRGLTLNGEKCKFNVPKIKFFGYIISAAGVRPTDQTVAAIRNARKPNNASEVRSFLGLVNYCSRFIPNFSTLAAPLRQLTCKSVPWTWTDLHQNAFERLQHVLTSDLVTAHFDPSAPTQLRVDASPVGLGAILTQTQDGQTKPVAYTQAALSHQLNPDIRRRNGKPWLLSGGVKNFTFIFTERHSTSSPITSPSWSSTAQHLHRQHALSVGDFVCNPTNSTFGTHLELTILPTFCLVYHSPTKCHWLVRRLKNMSSTSLKMLLPKRSH